MSGSPPIRTLDLSSVLLLLAIAAGLSVCALVAAPFLAAIVWSVTLAVLITPLDRMLEQATGRPSVAAAIMVALTAAVLVIPGILVIGSLLNEAVQSAPKLGSMVDLDSWRPLLERYPWLDRAQGWIQRNLDLSDAIGTLQSWLGGWSTSLVRSSFASVATLLLTFYFLFYLLRDRTGIMDRLSAWLPLSGDEFARVAARVRDTIVATVFGTVAVAALQGGLGGVMFYLLGLPAPAFWSVLMAFFAVVPFLGAFVIWAPAALFLLLQGHYVSAAILATWGTVVIGLVDNVLYPVLIGNRLRMHTIVSFIAVVGGLIVFGAPGIVLGPLLVALTMTLLDIWRERSAAPSAAS